MDAVGTIRAAISQCGQQITLTEEGVEHRFMACVMPRSYGAAYAQREEQSRFGALDTRLFSYYGPLTGGGELLREDVSFTAGNKLYRVVSCHDFYFREQAVFRFAVARYEDTEAAGRCDDDDAF